MGRHTEEQDASKGGFVHEDPVVDEALEWFLRLREGATDPAVQSDFDSWRSLSPRHAREYDDLEALWSSAPFGQAAGAVGPDARRGVAAPVLRLPQRPPHRRSGWRMAAAAVLLLAVAAWQAPGLILRWEADYITQTGDRMTVALPDGSSMTLDTASAAAVDFRNGRRNVRLLEGAAFFDVRHDPSRPFRVTSRFGETEVRGTAFSVRTDPDDDSVVLERGRVNVRLLADRGDHVELAPGEMVIATRGTLSAVTAVDAGNALAWRHGRIVFEDQSFSRVLDELRRYYPGRVFVADSRVGALRVTGNYRLDDIEGAIRTLADAAGVAMNRLPGGFIILH